MVSAAGAFCGAKTSSSQTSSLLETKENCGAKVVFFFFSLYLCVLKSLGVLSELCRCVDKEGAGFFILFY